MFNQIVNYLLFIEYMYYITYILYVLKTKASGKIRAVKLMQSCCARTFAILARSQYKLGVLPSGVNATTESKRNSCATSVCVRNNCNRVGFTLSYMS